MPGNRIVIVGSPGAGKSCFARKLRDRTGLPLYYLDRIFHRADHTTVGREEFDARLGEILVQPAWIIDGNNACDFPEWEGGELVAIVPTLNAYPIAMGSAFARYQIQIKVTYRVAGN
jgi:hypothetical protein